MLMEMWQARSGTIKFEEICKSRITEAVVQSLHFIVQLATSILLLLLLIALSYLRVHQSTAADLTNVPDLKLKNGEMVIT